MKRKAVTLAEVTIACLILMMAIVPLIMNSRHDASKAIETEKIQMAERILESIKSELMTTQFKTFYERAEEENLDKESAGPFELSDAYYPLSLSKVLEIQKKYKDFSVVGTWSWSIGEDGKPDKTMIDAKVSCSFSRPGPDVPPIERQKAFFIVKP